MTLLGRCTLARVSEKHGVLASAKYSAFRFELKLVPSSSLFVASLRYLQVVFDVLHEDSLIFGRILLHFLQHCFFYVTTKGYV